MGRILLALLAAAAACAQTPVTGVRIAGLQPQDWPLGDGGPAVQAALSPLSIAFDRDGSLLIADQMNARLRRLNAGGQISTVFPYSKYGLNTIVAITLDSQGNLYLSDQHIPDLSRLVRIAPDGSMTALNDLPPQPFAPAVAFDAAGNMYLTDFAANVVWRRSLNGALAKVAGSGKFGTEGENGPALEASLLGPRRVAFDSQGNLLIADAQRVLRVNPDGTITRLAGGGLMDLEPRSFAPAANGNIYISSGQARIWRWDPNGALSVVAGTGDTSLAFNDGCAASGGVPLAINALVSPYD